MKIIYEKGKHLLSTDFSNVLIITKICVGCNISYFLFYNEARRVFVVYVQIRAQNETLISSRQIHIGFKTIDYNVCYLKTTLPNLYWRHASRRRQMYVREIKGFSSLEQTSEELWTLRGNSRKLCNLMPNLNQLKLDLVFVYVHSCKKLLMCHSICMLYKTIYLTKNIVYNNKYNNK